MQKNVYMVLYILLMIGVIIGVDGLLLRHHFLARLLVNIGIVLVFGLVYFRFLRQS